MELIDVLLFLKGGPQIYWSGSFLECVSSLCSFSLRHYISVSNNNKPVLHIRTHVNFFLNLWKES